MTAARGFRAVGVAAGIKASALDLALVVSDRAASVAGVFTTNRMQAAPVLLCRSRIAAGKEGRAVVINSGCANACTGEPGFKDAEAMALAVAQATGFPESSVYVCSTGTIGKRLPMARVLAGIEAAAARLGNFGDDAARAIMTTDVAPKTAAARFGGANGATVGGMAKGAGMIDPRLATMLCILTTDANVAPAALQEALKLAVNRSFNRVCVDGDQSTNDTVLLFANGAAGGARLTPDSTEWAEFIDALTAVCLSLAQALVKDGEGATKFVTITVTGAADDAEALTAARAISRSALVKTAFFGADPNWGRVVCAAGYSGARLDPNRLTVRFDDIVAVRDGRPAPETSFEALATVFKKPSFEVALDLGVGQGTDTVYTCDLGYAYVKINAEYMT